MDDPWANAWGEPSNSNAKSQETWTLKNVNKANDAEADISMPSWSTGPAVQWAEPTLEQGTLWGSASESPGKLWSAPSPYEEINLGGPVSRDQPPSPPQTPKASSPPPPLGLPEGTKSEPETPEVQKEGKTSQPVSLNILTDSVATRPLESHHATINDLHTSRTEIPPKESPTEKHTKPLPLYLHSSAFSESSLQGAHLSIDPKLPEPGSPDGFGSFETGLDSADADGDPWAAPITVLREDTVANAGSEAWTSWGSETPNTADSIETEDEWEAAKRQKEMMDRHVPPHVLAGILREFDAFSDGLWPHRGSAPTGMQQGWQSGIEGVDGLLEQVDQLAPKDMILSQIIPFPKTFTGKKLGETLRLTRNLSSTRHSPFNLYLVSKGSTAWEVSVKSRIEASEDDVLPIGWRVVEKEEPGRPTEDTSKGKSSFFSFFGRRNTEDTGLKRTMTSVVGSSAPMSTTPSLSGGEPIRRSVDSNRSVKSPTRPGTPTTLSYISSSQSNPPSVDNVTTQSSLSPSTSEEPDNDVTLQPQSAVSRFLTRFSRPKGSHSKSPSQSMALSTDDIDFLSDVVPSVRDDLDEFPQQKELTGMFNSTQLLSKLPAPLPPPPRVTSLAAARVNADLSQSFNTSFDLDDDLLSVASTSKSQSLVPTPPSKSNPPSRQPSISSSSLSPDFSIFNMAPANHPAPNPSQQSAPSSSSRSESPFILPPPPRLNAAATARKAPVAIMSSAPVKRGTSVSFAPILPPPPASTTTYPKAIAEPTISSTSSNSIGDDFSDFFSSPARSLSQTPQQITPQSASSNAESSFFGDLSSDTPASTQTLKKQDSFDDFNSWTPSSSTLRTPSPPRVPAKPASHEYRPTEQARSVTPSQIKTLQPTFSSGTPHQTSVFEYQRTRSLTGSPDIFGNNTSRPSSTKPGVVPPPPGNGNMSRPSSTIPGILPPPPGDAPRIPLLSTFSATSNASPPPALTNSRTSSPAPASGQPLLPSFGAFSQALAPQSGNLFGTLTSNELPRLSKAPALQSQASQGPLSAQDLSFFEGL